MAAVLEVEPFANGHWVLAFDGRVLEIFGPILVGGGVNWTTVADSWRVHIKHLSVKPTGPDKHGLRGLSFCSLVNQKTKDGVVRFEQLDDAQWNRFQPLLGRTCGGGDCRSGQRIDRVPSGSPGPRDAARPAL
jgi:hypothetical protein